MTEFLAPIDIGNRACQHLGARRIDPTLGFNEISIAASEIGSCYGKLRRAELERNVWTFATRRAILRAVDTNTMLLAPTLWGASTTYFQGSIVADASGNLWQSRIPSNTGNDPTLTLLWEPYFGPMTADPYDSTTTYSAGEIVYTFAGDGTYRVYLSRISANADTPATATAWSSTVTYMRNQVATFSSVAYMSLIDLNLNQEPDLAPALFNLATTYAVGNKVGGSDGVIYQSVGSGNIGHDPTTDGGVHWTNTGVLNPWTTVFIAGAGSLNWLEIGGAEFPAGVVLTRLNILYPLGAGPSSQSATRNVYRLPNGFLKLCSQDPKAGSVSFLGAPAGLAYKDWLIENGYLVSAESGPIMLRFVADVTDVSTFQTMFCEGLGARIGQETCEKITQSNAKLSVCAAAYKLAMGDARTANAIEVGSEEPPVDDWLSCRH